MSQDAGSSNEVGSVGEEAMKLLGALGDWAKDHVAGAEDHLDTGAAECTYCPICKTVHVLRQASPELRTQLTTAATSLLQAFASMMTAPAPGERARSGVEHIDLDDDLDDWSEDTGAETGAEEGDR